MYSRVYVLLFVINCKYLVHFSVEPMTDNTATVIDNIYLVIIFRIILSVEILLTLSEHFSQFLSVKREKIDLKKVNICQRDYSTFSSDSFRDVLIKNWNYSNDNVHDSFNDFFY